MDLLTVMLIIVILVLIVSRKQSADTTPQSITVVATPSGGVQQTVVLTDISTGPAGTVYTGTLNDYVGAPKVFQFSYKERFVDNVTQCWFIRFDDNLVATSNEDVVPKDITVSALQEYTGFDIVSIA